MMREARSGHEPVAGRLHVAPETDGIVALRLEGEFDMATAPELVERIDACLENDNDVIVDLSEATFIDSSVLSALVHVRKAATSRGRAAVLQVGANENVRRVLELVSIEKLIPCAGDRAQAIRAIGEALPAE